MTKTLAPIRLAVGGIIHETNTYAAEFAGMTPLSAFERYYGEDIAQAFTGSNHQVGGFIEGARRHGATLLHTFLGQATPSGTIEGAAYADMKQAILDGIRQALPLDGILLALHGAGVADDVEDIEGDLVAAVRALVGPAMPIAAVYDLHGNMTEQMQQACDLTLPCKLYPHTDFQERGIESVDLLLRMIRGSLKPVTYVRRLPMLPYIVTTNTGFVPADVNEVCRKLGQQGGVIDCSWFHGFPYADIAAPCPAVICTTDGDLALAKRCADEAAAWIWRHREDFRPGFPAPAAGVAQAMAADTGPIVINEYADNPGGGTPGDGTHLLRALLEARPASGTCCFASINDIAVVRQAVHAGVGNTIRVSLGGKMGRFQGEPIVADAYVKAITDGRFTNRAGSMFEGVHFDLGAMCRLVIQGVDVIVASRAEQIYDAEPFLLHGIDAARYKIIALKGANHFRAGFRTLAAKIITVDSEGLSTAAITSFPRERLAAKVWPLDDGAILGE
ncbi:MAG: MlrC family protein 2 [Collimonas fungivorans]|uniref:M81 family metallopeptidase n=1 Tax=Collimonas fungivorans TaxID=158899 RepID=UPI0026ED6013|nr:M81 family metallopeptidase [Collimonas fungivorans]MDB5769368.1 MlrC family protein 2 [Collimonas fungivorans]